MKYHTIIALLLAAFFLSSCAQTQIEVTIREDFSGVVNLAVGIATKAYVWIEMTSEEDPFDSFQQFLQKQSGNQHTPFSRYRSGDYDWAEGALKFDNLEELKDLLMNTGAFQSVSIHLKRDIFADWITFDAVLDMPEMVASVGMDAQEKPAAGENTNGISWMDTQFRLKLPGKIISTNGVVDENGGLVWKGNNETPIVITVTSEFIRWKTLVAAAALFSAICVFGFLAIFAKGKAFRVGVEM